MKVDMSKEELADYERRMQKQTRVMWDEIAERPGDLKETLLAKIADCDQYVGLHPRFEKAFAFLKRPDLAELPLGRYEIDGDNCWAMVQEAELKPYPQPKGEVHRVYIDIQAPLSDEETLGVCDLPAHTVTQPFDEAKDIGFYEIKTKPLTLKPGEFAVFFPKIDFHMPCCTVGTPKKIKKLVIKIRN